MEIKNISVIGLGTMGIGIAQVSAQSGFNVSIFDKEQDIVKNALRLIDKNLNISLEKGKIKIEEKDMALKKITQTSELEECLKEADLVLEAVAEDLSIKKKVFKEIDKYSDNSSILGTNTSSLSITEIGSAVKDPTRVIGIHFFNPVQVMKLVEIIKGSLTSENTFKISSKFIEKLGKIAIKVNDYPGFVVNRLLVPMINEAANMVLEGIATEEDIDNAMKLGANHPIGPLALGDLIGLDVCLDIMKSLYTEFSDPRYRPSPILKKMVRANLLGKKTKKGFFNY